MMENCSRFNSCSANLCPLDRRRCERVWYPDEDYCHRTDIRPDWVITQQRLKRTVRNRDYPFTVAMIESIDRASGWIVGLKDNETEEEWIKRFTAKREKIKADYQSKGIVIKSPARNLKQGEFAL